MKARTKGLFALLACTAAMAAAQTVHIIDVKVSDPQTVYHLGEKIRLTPLTPPPSSLHVRLFFDSITHLKAYKTKGDKCVRYYTNILWGIGYPDSIRLDAIHDLVRRGSRGKPITVTLVFEDMDNPEPGGFGLRPDSVADYFSHAFEIQIIPSDTVDTVEDKVVQQFIQTVHTSAGAVSPTVSEPESVTTPPPPPCFKVDKQPATNRAEAGAASAEVAEATMTAESCEDLPIALPLHPAPSGL
jgi:hypothetical protein